MLLLKWDVIESKYLLNLQTLMKPS